MSESVVGPWAKDKLERLGKYLHAYTTILRKYDFDGYFYIDAFAGPGDHKVRQQSKAVNKTARLFDPPDYIAQEPEQQQYLAGSPRVALELQYPFSKYVFVERSPERVASLERLEQEYPSRNIAIRQADCTKYLKHNIAENAKIDWRRYRALVLLDPFGMQVEWDTIEALARTGAIEIFLNFPVGMAINRMLPRQSEKISDGHAARLDRYFGSTEWRNALYKRSRTLFDEDAEEKVAASGAALLDWYRKRLRSIFKHVSKEVLVKNTKGGHLYYLLVATQNATGAKIASDIFSKPI